MAVFSDDNIDRMRNSWFSASEVGSHVFDEGQTVDTERRGSFALAAGPKDATRYLR